MSRAKRLAAVGITATVALLFAATPALADWSALNMTRGVTTNSGDVYDLHMTIFWISTIIGVVVFGAMFYAILRHRKSRGVTPSQFHHSTVVEIVWTVIPLLILMGMAIPATRVLIDMSRTEDADMTIIVTGYQWLWGYEYVEDDIQFYSSIDDDSNEARQRGSETDPWEVDAYLENVDNPVVVPVDTKIRFQITSADVIHSWWVPDLGWKQDAMPGYVNETWAEITEPGIYRGKCAELCGRDHAFMPVVVDARSPEDYEAWVAEQHEEAEEAEDETAAATDEDASDDAGLAAAR